MRPLTPHPYVAKGLVKTKTDKMGNLRFESNWYSVSPQQAQTEVWVEYDAFAVTILDLDYQTIITHPRLYGTNQESMIWVPYLETLAKHPHVLKYTAFYQELPRFYQEYLSTLEYQEKKRVLATFAQMVHQKGMDEATRSLDETLQGPSPNHDHLILTFRRRNTDSVEHESRTGPQTPFPSLSSHPDLIQYDQFFKGGNLS